MLSIELMPAPGLNELDFAVLVAVRIEDNMNLARDDISTLINDFIVEAQAAARALSDRDGLSIESEHVENALVETLALDDSTDLLCQQLKRDKILLILEAYEFRKFFPVRLAEVVFEESIIPSSVPQRLEEQRVRHHGQVWQINLNDADPFPSNPHAHNLQSGYKMDLSTGRLFLGRRDVGEKVSRKDLLAIRKKAHHPCLPPLLV
jgi:hypothetical protein